MAANKQCPYRSQEHECKHDIDFHNNILSYSSFCTLCLSGQKADLIGLVASAIMEKSIEKIESKISNLICTKCGYEYNSIDIYCPCPKCKTSEFTVIK